MCQRCKKKQRRPQEGAEGSRAAFGVGAEGPVSVPIRSMIGPAANPEGDPGRHLNGSGGDRIERFSRTYRAHRGSSLAVESHRKVGKVQAGPPRFVVQVHDATTLHYDFRLEINGMLKSWILPHGPSLDPRSKCLAILNEDRALEYARLEGVIPKGQEDAGTMLVWDAGTYHNTTVLEAKSISLPKAIKRGHLSIWLRGKKLVGGFVLSRVGRGKSAHWVLMKLDDEYANVERNPALREPNSVLTGRTLVQVAMGQTAQSPRYPGRTPDSIPGSASARSL
jgi:DNA ligase D-like protein (predicted 3'-phosphoesterase)